MHCAKGTNCPNLNFTKHFQRLYIGLTVHCSSFMSKFSMDHTLFIKKGIKLFRSLPFVSKTFWDLVAILYSTPYSDTLFQECTEKVKTCLQEYAPEKMRTALNRPGWSGRKLWLCAPTANRLWGKNSHWPSSLLQLQEESDGSSPNQGTVCMLEGFRRGCYFV